LAIRQREIPASLNFREPNPQIQLDELNLRVQTQTTPWPQAGRPLIAGISSFGMGGTGRWAGSRPATWPVPGAPGTWP
jgi:acyl transferase domain-containing protein